MLSKKSANYCLWFWLSHRLSIFFYFFRSNWHVNIKWIALFARISFIPHGSFFYCQWLRWILMVFLVGSIYVVELTRENIPSEYGLVHRLSLLFQRNKFIWKQHSIILRFDIFTIAVLDELPEIKKNETSLFAFFRNRKTQRNVCMLIQLERACVLKEGAFLNHWVD